MDSVAKDFEMVLEDGQSGDKDKNVESKPELLTLPMDVREKMFQYLNADDCKTLRLVCNKLRIEAERFGTFPVYYKKGQYALRGRDAEIPFRNIGTLTIDSLESLPWGDAEGDSLQVLHCTDATFGTLRRLGRIGTVKEATLGFMVLTRPLPELDWPKLCSLSLIFWVPREQTEAFMLDNLDGLLDYFFPSMKSFSISLSNSKTPNIQSNYSTRVARFIARHWETLKALFINFNAISCVHRNYRPSKRVPPNTGLQECDLENFLKIKLTKLELNLAEISCPRCIIWKMLLQEQTDLELLRVQVASGDTVPSNFFCNPKYTDQFTKLENLNVRLWGQGSYFPLDFKVFESAHNLSYFEMARYAEPRVQVTRSEVLNVNLIPWNIESFSLTGFLIDTSEVQRLLYRLRNTESITMLDCGSSGDLGITTENAPDFCQHPALSYALLDFNTEAPDTQRSLRVVEENLETLEDFGYHVRHLYETGFNQHHRFEFYRTDFGYAQEFFKDFDNDPEFDLNYHLRLPSKSLRRYR